MRILIKDTHIGISDFSKDEQSTIQTKFTYQDKSQAMTRAGYDPKKVRNVSFVAKSKGFMILRSGFLRELFAIIKQNRYKVTEVKDDRTKFPFQGDHYDATLRKYFDPDFDYVEHQIRALKAMLKTNIGVLKLPTSAGKSSIIEAFLKLTNVPTLILVDGVSLSAQLAGDLNKAGLDVGICNGKGVKKAYHMVSTLGSVKKLTLSNFQCVIIDECFSGRTLVHTENGKKTISSLVRNKSNERVWSFNSVTKKFELKEIYDWFEKTTENKMLKITHNVSNSNIKTTANHKFWIIEDNKIIQKRADELKVGDRSISEPIYSKNNNGLSPRLSRKQYQAVLGMVLGDSCISKTTNLARLGFSQGESQKEYLEYKLSILDNMYFRDNLTNGKSGYCNNTVFNTSTQSSLDFLDLYDKIYIDGVKVIKNIIEEIDEISLAFLVMDDGCLQKGSHYDLSTHSFSEDENRMICNVLKNKFNIDSHIRIDKRINKSWIYVSTTGSKILSSIIAKYVCKSMDYKLFEEDRGKFNFKIDDKYEYGIKEIKKIEEYVPKNKTVYNISVKDNHNYLVSSGVLVSNCHGAAARTYQEFLSSVSFPLRYGLSATPDANGDYRWACIRQFLGSIISETFSKELLDNNVITPPKITFLPVSCVPTLDWQAAYDSNIVNNSDRNLMAVRIAEETELPTLILFKIIEHGEKLHKMLPDAVLLSGKDSLKVRQEAVERFKRGEIKTLIASNIFKQGISISNIEVLINVSGGKSKVEVLQKIGRALRKSDGKTVALVYDFLDKGNDFTHRHSLQREKLYRDAGFDDITHG